MTKFEWLLFLMQLPATPSSLRVTVWRRLRDAGATSLQSGGWILPLTEENQTFMESLLAYVKQNDASGQIFVVQELNQATHDDIITRFQVDRSQEYDELLEQCEAFLAELEKEASNQKFTFAELEENEQNLQRLEKWIAKIQKRDFFEAQKSQEAVAAFQSCRQRLQDFSHQVYVQAGIEVPQDADIFSEGTGQTGREKNDDIE